MSEMSRAGICVGLMVLGLTVVGMTEVAFPWEALATVLAGIMAVGGAVVVASKQMAISKGQNGILKEQAEIARRQADILDKQVEISKRQVDILDKQVDLEGLSIKGDLFDRRYEVFSAAALWLNVVLNQPSGLNLEELKGFKEGLDRGRFLFGKDANERLKELAVVSLRFTAMKHRTDAIIAAGKEPKTEDVQECLELEKWLRDRKYNLADVFGPELAVTNDPFVFKESFEPVGKYWAIGRVDSQAST